LQATGSDSPLSTPGGWSWDEMLDGFRALGGIADNVVLGHGPLGRGLFPLDASNPVLLRVPNNLLFVVEDVEFEGDRIRIKATADVAKPERDFFENYSNAFSWGGEGQSDSTRYIAALDALPSDVRDVLAGDFGLDEFVAGDPIQRTRKRFLKSRMIEQKGREVLMPLLELANQGPAGFPYTSEAGGALQVEGSTPGEILVSYGPHDGFGIFFTFGFAAQQPHAFSLPMKTKSGALQLRIEWDTDKHDKRGDVPTPQMRVEGDERVLSYLMIGHPKFPQLSRGIFQTLMRDAGVQNADEIFERILYFNRQRFLKLLATLEPHRGDVVATLRRMARYQLVAMTHCVGTREV
jgi:hypothetical protein